MWVFLDQERQATLEAGRPWGRAMGDAGDDAWIVDLVSSLATPENRLQEIMLLDVLAGPLLGRSVGMHHFDPATGQRTKVVLPAIEAALGSATPGAG